MSLLRTVWWFIFFFGYLIYSLPTLKKIKRLPDTITEDKKREIVHRLPKNWAKKLVQLTRTKVSVSGEDNIPPGPVLLVSNHQGNFDVPILLGYINKPFGFISKIEVKKIPLISRWMEVMECVFIDRTDRRKAIMSIRDGVEKMKAGNSIVLFPEGTRSKGPKMNEFKTGGLRLAIDSKVPIVPIKISGSYVIMEKSKWGFQPGNVSVVIGKPITLPEGKIDSKELALQLQNVIEQL